MRSWAELTDTNWPRRVRGRPLEQDLQVGRLAADRGAVVDELHLDDALAVVDVYHGRAAPPAADQAAASGEVPQVAERLPEGLLAQLERALVGAVLDLDADRARRSRRRRAPRRSGPSSTSPSPGSLGVWNSSGVARMPTSSSRSRSSRTSLAWTWKIRSRNSRSGFR